MAGFIFLLAQLFNYTPRIPELFLNFWARGLNDESVTPSPFLASPRFRHRQAVVRMLRDTGPRWRVLRFWGMTMSAVNRMSNLEKIIGWHCRISYFPLPQRPQTLPGITAAALIGQDSILAIMCVGSFLIALDQREALVAGFILLALALLTVVPLMLTSGQRVYVTKQNQ